MLAKLTSPLHHTIRALHGPHWYWASPLLLAGLYAPAVEDKGRSASVTVVTMPACKRFSEIHDRQPALLSPDSARKWLDVHHVGADDAVAVLMSECAELPAQVTW
jgi:putative SOS response-associated peptidase YedK